MAIERLIQTAPTATMGTRMSKTEWLRTEGRRLQEEHDRDLAHLAEQADTRIALIERDQADRAPAREREVRATTAAVESAKAEYDAAVSRCAAIRERQHAEACAAARDVRDVRQATEFRQSARTQELRKALEGGWFDYKQSAAAHPLRDHEVGDSRDEHGAFSEASE